MNTLFSHVCVGHANKGVGPDRHPLVHRDDADMGKEGIHSHSS